MSLTIADIERWDAGDVREVFYAANSRAQAAEDAVNGIATLPAFTTWGGKAAEAAWEAISKTSQDLAAHGAEARAVASAARSAADEIERIRSELATLKSDASALDMEIDPATNQVVAGPGFKGNAMELLLKQEQLQARVNKLLGEANVVDLALANAITRADGSTLAPDGQAPQDRPGLYNAPQEDPRQFGAVWDTLTEEQRDGLFEQDRFIGNQGGIPIVERDPYNQLHLDELQQAAQAKVDQLQADLDELARGTYMGDSPATASQFAALSSQLAAARHQLEGYNKVRGALEIKDGVPRYLTYIDDQGRAAVAMGNPDTATHTATLVPGTGQDLPAFEGASQKSAAMYYAALEADKSLKDKLAVTTWMGYDRPMDLFEAGSQDYARDGAGALDAYLAGVQASHTGAGSLDTVIGHSYGSTLVGAAGSNGHHLAAENVIAVGSPGMLVGHASELSLDPGGEVYATRAENDVIRLVPAGVLRKDPTWDSFGAVELEAGPGETTGPPIIGLPSVDAHSSYWDPGNPALINMGAVIAGQPPPQIVPDK